MAVEVVVDLSLFPLVEDPSPLNYDPFRQQAVVNECDPFQYRLSIPFGKLKSSNASNWHFFNVLPIGKQN